MWVLGAVDRNTGQCFLIPCTNNSRTAATLLASYHSEMDTPWHHCPHYNGLTAAGYTHLTVNHDIQFVNPLTGVHTNTQEGLWHNVKKNMDGRKSLEMFW